MHSLRVISAIAVLSVAVLAQDKVTLNNGDVLSGKITSMVDGKLTIVSPFLQELVISLVDIKDLVTKDPVTLKTKTGDEWQRRIVGIEGGSLRLEGGATKELSLDNLHMINPPEETASAWRGSLKFAGVVSTGNTERRSAGLFFEAVRSTDDDRLSFDATWEYADDKPSGSPSGTSNTLTVRRVGAGLKYDYYLTNRAYSLVTTRVLGDTIANLDLRLTAGIGAGYTLIKDDESLFLLELGLSYLYESYRVVVAPDPSSTNYVAARVAYRYEKQLSDATRLVHRAEAFPSIESADDIYLQVTTELTTSLTKSMVATLSHVLDYDNTPSPGFERSDNRVILSVGWSF